MQEAEGTRRVLTRSRKPFSDLTNTSHNSPLPLPNPNKPNLPSSSSSSCSPKSAAKRASTTIVPIDNVSSNPSTPPPSVSPEPSSPKTSSLHGTVVDLEGSEPISVVYSRRSAPNRRSAWNKKGKGKAVAFAFSSAPALKISDSRQKSDRVEGSNPPKAKALTVPCRKKRRAVSSEQDMFKDPAGASEQDIFKDPLLQDYIEKQKAYFKMIDEFTLSEEEVERVDELD